MPAPVYDSELLDALAKVFAEAALDQLIRDMDSEAKPGEQFDDDLRPVMDAKAGA
jgi:hypothetical protein